MHETPTRKLPFEVGSGTESKQSFYKLLAKLFSSAINCRLGRHRALHGAQRKKACRNLPFVVLIMQRVSAKREHTNGFSLLWNQLCCDFNFLTKLERIKFYFLVVNSLSTLAEMLFKLTNIFFLLFSAFLQCFYKLGSSHD